MTKKDYNIKLVTKWEYPKDGEDLRPLIAMPNLPKPLHGMAPRTLLGKPAWDEMRKSCYEAAGMKCEVCGAEVGKDIKKIQLHAHEVYNIDYKKGTSTFVRCVALCARCHLGGIHTGRAITLFKHNNPLYPKEFLLSGAENAFKLVYEYNQEHHGADVRLYSTFLDYLKNDDLRPEMERLIDNYRVKFYEEDKKSLADWGKWKLIIGNKEYLTKYENYQAWEEAMQKAEDTDNARLLQKEITTKFSGGVYDEIDKILDANK